MKQSDLKALPVEHSLRNAPLADIGAEYQWEKGGPWKRVFRSFRIAGSTFNSLGTVWTNGWNWRADSASGVTNARKQP